MPRGRWIMKSSPGRCISGAGYIQVRLVNHPFFPDKRYDYEHRVVMAEHIGRPLRKGEEVHHKKPPRSNNHISNLVLMGSRKAHAQEHRQPCSPETRAKISASNTGKVRTPEMCKRLSKSLKGIPKSEKFKRQVSQTMKGRPSNNPNGPSLAARKLISQKLRGRKISEETRGKMRKSASNRSVQYRLKLSKAAKAQWARWRVSG